MALAQLIHRIVTDAAFAQHFLSDSQAALEAAGMVLDDRTIAAVLAVLPSYTRAIDVYLAVAPDAPLREWR